MKIERARGFKKWGSHTITSAGIGHGWTRFYDTYPTAKFRFISLLFISRFNDSLPLAILRVRAKFAGLFFCLFRFLTIIKLWIVIFSAKQQRTILFGPKSNGAPY